MSLLVGCGYPRFLAWSLAWVALLYYGAVGEESAQASGDRGFCQPSQVRNLAAPLKALPDVPRIPSSQRLPFTSAPVEMLSATFNEIIVGSGKAGAVLVARRPTRLNWHVATRMVRVDRRGHRQGKTRERSWVIGRLGKARAERAFVFQVGGRPALYRYDIWIRDASGELLGHFAEYSRVVRREVEADLKLSASTYEPGATLTLRLRNLGTATIYYGYELAVERWAGSTWVKDPATPDGWLLIGLGLFGGQVGDCEFVALGTTTGEYRVSKVYSPLIAGGDIPVHARFNIG